MGEANRRGRRLPHVGNESGFGLVEMLVATTVAMVGLLSVAGLQLAVATQARLAAWRTNQAVAAQEVFERLNEAGYASVVTGSDSVAVDGQVYRVNLVVTTPSNRVKRVQATVAAAGSLGPATFITRIHDRRPVPPF